MEAMEDIVPCLSLLSFSLIVNASAIAVAIASVEAGLTIMAPDNELAQPANSEIMTVPGIPRLSLQIKYSNGIVFIPSLMGVTKAQSDVSYSPNKSSDPTS